MKGDILIKHITGISKLSNGKYEDAVKYEETSSNSQQHFHCVGKLIHPQVIEQIFEVIDYLFHLFVDYKSNIVGVEYIDLLSSF